MNVCQSHLMKSNKSFSIKDDRCAYSSKQSFNVLSSWNPLTSHSVMSDEIVTELNKPSILLTNPATQTLSNSYF